MGSPVGDPVNRLVALTASSLMIAGLAACSSEPESTAGAASVSSEAAVTTPTPEPTPPEVIWAGQYCTDRKAFDAAVQGFGRDLKIDTGGDIIDQLDKQLRWQALAVGDALSGLLTTLAVVPPELSSLNSAVNGVVTTGTKAQEDLATLGTEIDGVVKADNIADGALKAAAAVGTARTAYESVGKVVEQAQTLFDSQDPQLRSAMDQAPECSGL